MSKRQGSFVKIVLKQTEVEISCNRFIEMIKKLSQNYKQNINKKKELPIVEKFIVVILQKQTVHRR